MTRKGLATFLGIDIGTNSVGSAWVDTDKRQICVAVSIFPAGVEEQQDKRGAPKNQKRRQTRSQRRSVARRARRKRQLRATLIEAGLLPAEGAPFDHDTRAKTPWELRAEGLQRTLTPHEFGRVLVHLNQRRGAFGVHVDSEEDDHEKDERAEDDDTREGSADEQKVKAAIRSLKRQLKGRTFGQFMAQLYDQRKHAVSEKDGKCYRNPIRNRRDAFEFHAERTLIREEFHRLWKSQKCLSKRDKNSDKRLANLLSDDLKKRLDDPTDDDTWRHKGLIFGQRRTFWNAGTLGRCDLEPSDHRCPHADMYAQEFHVLETVNNIRLTERGSAKRPLTDDEQAKVIHLLRTKEKVSITDIRKQLNINKKDIKAFYALTLEEDPDREINKDWFHREIVAKVFGERRWNEFTDHERDSVNRAILKFDPEIEEHAERLRTGARKWWALSDEAAGQLAQAWKKRPQLEKRANLSRRAIRNLLPYLRRRDPETDRWLSVTEARQRFAEDEQNNATPEQRVRYAFNVTDSLWALLIRRVGERRTRELLRLRTTNKADRHFMKKHPHLLPPAPMLANPVVRAAIHEVRRHVNAYLRKFGRKPDRIVIEMARSARQSAKVRSRILARNRMREKIKRQIIEQHCLENWSKARRAAAVDRVLLCRQQRYVCPYTGLTDENKSVCAYTGATITERQAAQGEGVEVDHIVPKSTCWDNSLNNKVLCRRDANRGKGSQTPQDWLSDEQFEQLRTRFAYFEKHKPPKEDYFTKNDYARKWENLNRPTPSLGEFRNSQLSDTAYAARQVTQWLRDVLYDGDAGKQRHVFTTKGSYTAALRRDWQLQRRDGPKPRIDHRHHAIDAVAIAMTGPETLQELAHNAAKQEEAKANLGSWPEPDPLPPPWGSVEQFRDQVTQAVQHLVVAHRPVKRKLIGKLHKETAYGPVAGSKTLFTKRIRVYKNSKIQLKPSHLRMPLPESDKQVIARMAREYEKTGIATRQARRMAREAVKEGRFRRRLVDPPLGKSGIVRDRALRKQIRNCLSDNDVDPDTFTAADIKKLAQENKIRMASGVPIKNVVLLQTFKSVVRIPRRRWDEKRRKMVPIEHPQGKPLRTDRVYESQNNHHVEIREDHKGNWTGKVVTMHVAACRVRAQKKPAVDRSDHDGKRFVMSLAAGEMIKIKSPTMKATHPAENDYFVVVKINPKVRDSGSETINIEMAHHADARPVSGKDPATGDKLKAPHPLLRETISLSPAQLKALAPDEEKTPYKVRIDVPVRIQRVHDRKNRLT